MFDPIELPQIKEKYKNMTSCEELKIDSHEKNDIYETYFICIERMKLLDTFNKEIVNELADLKSFITHKNENLRELLYGCYQTLKKMSDSIPSDIEKFDGIRKNMIEKFHSNFEKNENL